MLTFHSLWLPLLVSTPSIDRALPHRQLPLTFSIAASIQGQLTTNGIAYPRNELKYELYRRLLDSPDPASPGNNLILANMRAAGHVPEVAPPAAGAPPNPVPLPRGIVAGGIAKRTRRQVGRVGRVFSGQATPVQSIPSPTPSSARAPRPSAKTNTPTHLTGADLVIRRIQSFHRGGWAQGARPARAGPPRSVFPTTVEELIAPLRIHEDYVAAAARGSFANIITQAQRLSPGLGYPLFGRELPTPATPDVYNANEWWAAQETFFPGARPADNAAELALPAADALAKALSHMAPVRVAEMRRVAEQHGTLVAAGVMRAALLGLTITTILGFASEEVTAADDAAWQDVVDTVTQNWEGWLASGP